MSPREVDIEITVARPSSTTAGMTQMAIPSPFAAGVHPLTGMAPVGAPMAGFAGMLPAWTGAAPAAARPMRQPQMVCMPMAGMQMPRMQMQGMQMQGMAMVPWATGAVMMPGAYNTEAAGII